MSRHNGAELSLFLIDMKIPPVILGFVCVHSIISHFFLSIKSGKAEGQIHMISIDDLIPENHILRKIDAAIDFDFIYDEV